MDQRRAVARHRAGSGIEQIAEIPVHCGQRPTKTGLRFSAQARVTSTRIKVMDGLCRRSGVDASASGQDFDVANIDEQSTGAPPLWTHRTNISYVKSSRGQPHGAPPVPDQKITNVIILSWGRRHAQPVNLVFVPTHGCDFFAVPEFILAYDLTRSHNAPRPKESGMQHARTNRDTA